MTIDEWWNLLNPGTQRWLADNPGCLVLPRTVVNAVNRARAGLLPEDPHGECTLSRQDRDFIRRQARTRQASSP